MELADANWSAEYDGETFEVDALGKKAVGCHWRVKEGPTKYVVLYIHGLCSCVCFNANVMRVFTEHGGAALATDHIGHGRSPGGRSQTTVEQIVDEIHHLVEYTKSIYNDIPIYLFGHSLGGLSSISYILNHHVTSDIIKGVIIIAPWMRTRKHPNPAWYLRFGMWALSWIYPSAGLDTGLDIMKSDAPEGYKQAIAGSPYIQTKASFVILSSAVYNMSIVQTSADKFPSDIPMLFMQGTADPQVDPEFNKQWATSIPNCEYIEYENGPHDLIKSEHRPDVYKKIFKFIGVD